MTCRSNIAKILPIGNPSEISFSGLARLYKYTRRAVALCPASVLALVAAFTCLLKFYFKVFKTLYFLNSQMDLVYILYDNRCWSKLLLSTIHTPANDLEVKVTDLEM